jgi:nucleotide-binding universal stress UspA family protein
MATMTAFKKVLIPVKLSKQPNQIISLIQGLIKWIQPEIHVIYVAPAIPHTARFPFPNGCREELEAKILIRAEESLKEFLKLIPKNIILKPIVTLGDPTEQILNYVQNVQIDLIIMVGRKKYTFERFFLGSVVDQVLKESPVPVFTIISNIEYDARAKGKKLQTGTPVKKTTLAILEHILYESEVSTVRDIAGKPSHKSAVNADTNYYI